MVDKIIKSYRVKLYPTPEQERILSFWVSQARGLWNSLLSLEMKTYRESGKFLWRQELQDRVVRLKRDPEMRWLAELPAHLVLVVIHKLCAALKSSSKKAKHRKGFPKFKRKRWDTGSAYVVNYQTRFFSGQHRIHFPKAGLLKYRGDGLPTGRLRGSRVFKRGRCWYLISQFDCIKPEAPAARVARYSVDLGIDCFATTYDGKSFGRVETPGYLRKAERILKQRQRALSRAKKGSSRRMVRVLKIQSLHKKIANKRTDFLHKLSHQLITKAAEIRVESLNIKGMLQNHYLAKSISDASMGEFLRQLKYKAGWYGRKLVQVPRFFPSSQLCFSCGARHPEMKNLSRRTLVCECGFTKDRDENAALNIYWYEEEPRNRVANNDATDVEIGDHADATKLSQVPVVEASTVKSSPLPVEV